MFKAKYLIRFLTILLLVSVILRFCFVIMHFNHHDCTHYDSCPVCTLIHSFKNDLCGFDSNLTKVVIAILLLFSSITFCLKDNCDKKKFTLIGLKVELIS